MASFSIFKARDYRQECLVAEKTLLASVEPEGVEFAVRDTRISLPSAADAHIHTIEASCASNPMHGKDCNERPPVVLWHGYGQGAASWWRNFSGLAKTRAEAGGRVLAIDWLGVGLSSRTPAWTDEMAAEPAKAEAYFVDALEAWREKEGFEKMHLVGHSMGGILAVSYAERYPQRLASLILASPAGVPQPPPESINERIATMPFGFRKIIFGVAANFWEGGSTPQGVMRNTEWLPFVGGKNLIDGYVQRRFDESVPSKAEFADYMYRHWQNEDGAVAGGEKVLSALLLPGAYAKRPLCDRVPNLDPSVPISFIYGSRDWMEIRPARELAAAAAEGQQIIDVHQIPDAGHQLYIDQPGAFNEIILSACSIQETGAAAGGTQK